MTKPLELSRLTAASTPRSLSDPPRASVAFDGYAPPLAFMYVLNTNATSFVCLSSCDSRTASRQACMNGLRGWGSRRSPRRGYVG